MFVVRYLWRSSSSVSLDPYMPGSVFQDLPRESHEADPIFLLEPQSSCFFTDNWYSPHNHIIQLFQCLSLDLNQARFSKTPNIHIFSTGSAWETVYVCLAYRYPCKFRQGLVYTCVSLQVKMLYLKHSKEPGSTRIIHN